MAEIFVLTLKEDFQMTVAIDLKALLAALIQMGVKKYVFGSFKIEATADQMVQLMNDMKFITVKKGDISDLDTWREDWDRLFENELLFEAALKNHSDSQATFSFMDEFDTYFKMTDKKGSIKVDAQYFNHIEAFMVRYGQLIVNVSGMFPYVPKFIPSGQNRQGNSANQMEMMKCFVTAYPTYVNVCRNNNREKHERWNFDVEIINA
eukprot:gene9886-10933_t